MKSGKNTIWDAYHLDEVIRNTKAEDISDLANLNRIELRAVVIQKTGTWDILIPAGNAEWIKEVRNTGLYSVDGYVVGTYTSSHTTADTRVEYRSYATRFNEIIPLTTKAIAIKKG